MYKTLQYTDALRNIIIYEHNSILKIPTIFSLHLMTTRYENRYKSKDGIIKKL
jgi:hypothetical protein